MQLTPADLNRIPESRRVRIEVTVADPRGSHAEIHNARPRHARWPVRPCLKVGSLAALQLSPLQLSCDTLILHGLLTAQPATSEHAGLLIRLEYLRELLTVSKMISRSWVTAMPTSADWTLPEEDRGDHSKFAACNEASKDRFSSFSMLLFK